MSFPAGSFNLEKTKDAIWFWVQSVAASRIQDSQIIWRDQSEPLPKRPCITLKIIDGPSPIARNGNLMPLQSSNGPYTVGIQLEMVVSVQIFGDTRAGKSLALQLSMDLNSSLIRQTILDKLQLSQVAVQEVGKVRNLSALEESQYEERAGFEVGFGCVQNITDQPGFIETVNVEVKAKNAAGTVVYDKTKNIVLP